MSFQQDIKTPDAFKSEILEVPGMCQVVELYSSWSGPCKAIVSTFKASLVSKGQDVSAHFRRLTNTELAFAEDILRCRGQVRLFVDCVA